jgi:hypothetical protein
MDKTIITPRHINARDNVEILIIYRDRISNLHDRHLMGMGPRWKE